MRTKTLTVAMNGDVVGTLYRDGSGAMSFQYAHEWLSEPGSRAISLSLPLQHSRIKGKELSRRRSGKNGAALVPGPLAKAAGQHADQSHF